MAGIYGKVSTDGVTEQELSRMSRALAHRGPDDEGVYIHNEIGMGCRRLSVRDPQGGRQPISNEDESIWVVHNGEIYNYAQLRKSLEHKGHVFRTQTDTEVIVHLYEEFGERCPEKLRGMFAFALWDKNRHRLILARDHLGQKPLFYSQVGGQLVFASEVKAIVSAQSTLSDIDYESLQHYLSLRFIPAPGTMLRQIKKLPPAHVLVYEDGSTSLSRYWDLSFRKKLPSTEAELIEGLREKLRETVASHVISDVPVGAFLSGGLDSSIIVAMMAKSLSPQFPTFSVGVEDTEFNELPYAREVSRYCGTKQVETCAKVDIIGLLPHLIWSLDEPSDVVGASKYLASQLASTQVKVVLGGDGGDELFAGFDRYSAVSLVDYYARIPQFVRQIFFNPIISRIPASFRYESIAEKLRWVRQVSALPSVAERFAEAVCFFRFNHGDKHALLSDRVWQEVSHIDSSDLIVNLIASSQADDPIDQMVYTDYMMRLPEHSLMLTDRLGMAHGVEVRSPLVDHELVEYVARFPVRMKIRGKQRKYAQRKVAERELPAVIADRKKRGFRLPLASWFGNELYPFLHRFRSESQCVREGILRKDTVLRLLEEHRDRHIDHHVRLWMLLSLEVWFRLVIQGSEPASVAESIKSGL
jgi:asparagine synthase (glutamine-hydrolysing)